jgi:hypothetical protein
MPRGRYKRRNKLMQPTSVQLDKVLHNFLIRRARSIDTTMGALIRKILHSWRTFELAKPAPIEVEGDGE